MQQSAALGSADPSLNDEGAARPSAVIKRKTSSSPTAGGCGVGSGDALPLSTGDRGIKKGGARSGLATRRCQWMDDLLRVCPYTVELSNHAGDLQRHGAC